MQWLDFRKGPRLGLGDGLVLLAYAGLVSFGIAHHVPWADEAQSWLLARDLTLPQLFGTYLHYEGTPGLWCALLWLLQHLGLTYRGMNWVSGILGVAGAAVWLRYSPFPNLLRWLLPLSFYFCFQYAVVGRSYSLLPPLLFAAAAVASRDMRNLPAFAALMGLAANVSLHGVAIAAGLGIATAYFLFKRGPSANFVPRRKQIAISGVLFSVLCMAAILTAWPTRDNSYRSFMSVHARLAGKPATAAAQSTGAPNYGPSIQQHGHHNFTFQRVAEIATTGLSPNRWLSISVLVLLAAVVCLAGQPLLLLAYPLLLILGEIAVIKTWHYGINLLALVLAWWLAESWREKAPGKLEAKLRALLVVLLAAVLLQQAWWTFRALRSQTKQPYSGDLEAAEFLRPLLPNHSVAGFSFWSVGVQPYFKKNIFENQPADHAFWFFSASHDVDAQLDAMLQSQPDYIVLGSSAGPGSKSLAEQSERLRERILATQRYREVRRFCGISDTGTQSFQLCQAILQRTP